MIVAGARGFAKELLEILWRDYKKKYPNIVFFDNVSKDLEDKLYDYYDIIRTEEGLKEFNDKKFCLGVGTPYVRKKLYELFVERNKHVETIISGKASIGSFNTNIAEGCTIMDNVVITNDIVIGRCTLININCTIGHDSIVGEFCDISPNVNISGKCKIGDYCSVGTSAVVIPNIKIGNNCVIGAGTVVINDIPDNSVVVGVPGKVVKKIEDTV